MSEAFDLSSTYVHLGLGATAEPLPGFEFSPEYLSAYGVRTEGDGDDGRLVLYDHQDASWETWERHPADEEVVVLVSKPPHPTVAAAVLEQATAMTTPVVSIFLGADPEGSGGGILAAGSEFRHQTIVPVLLATPHRARVFAVKVAVIAALGAKRGAPRLLRADRESQHAAVVVERTVEVGNLEAYGADARALGQAETLRLNAVVVSHGPAPWPAPRSGAAGCECRRGRSAGCGSGRSPCR